MVRASDTTALSTLSLHDALPISNSPARRDVLGTVLLSVLSGYWRYAHMTALRGDAVLAELLGMNGVVSERSEEHTSELQSRENLVCRLLLEKKKAARKPHEDLGI